MAPTILSRRFDPGPFSHRARSLLSPATSGGQLAVAARTPDQETNILCMRTVTAIALVALIAAASAPAQTAPTGTSWQLVWSDEFNGPAGSQPNPTHWTYDLGTDCCGN